MKGLDQLVDAIKGVFRTQKRLAAAGKERFGDWNFKLAKAIEEPLIQMYFHAAKSAKMKRELAPDFVAVAKERILESSRLINGTTSDWISEGRDPFEPSRVAGIAQTEAMYAMNAARSMVINAKGKKLRWKVGKKPCKICLRFKGKTVRPGTPFGIVNGQAIYIPPVHPHCYCSVEEV